MKITGKDLLYGVAAIGLAYALWKIVRAGGAIADGAGKFWQGLVFDESELGESPKLTEGASLTQEQWIDLGYLEVLPDGRTRITPAGEAYIERRKRGG